MGIALHVISFSSFSIEGKGGEGVGTTSSMGVRVHDGILGIVLMLSDHSSTLAFPSFQLPRWNSSDVFSGFRCWFELEVVHVNLSWCCRMRLMKVIYCSICMRQVAKGFPGPFMTFGISFPFNKVL